MKASSDDLRMELDSHYNKVVLGQNSFVNQSTRRTCNVQIFSSNLGITSNVPIADGALACYYPCTGDVHVLVLTNALYIPSMDHNMSTPFIMRASGVTINGASNTHCEDPAVYDRCMLFD